MYFDDHAPPHIHVEYQGQEAQIAFADVSVVNGRLPKQALTLVCQWCLDHREELEQNWSNAQALKPLSRIAGADND